MTLLARIVAFINVIQLLINMLFGIVMPHDDIVILYTNDVHCAVEENIGYSGIAAYKKSVERRTDNVTLVDCGDSVQGGLIGTVSKGEYIVDIMNEVGYDYAVLGNHEFDYGMSCLSGLIGRAEYTFLGCNITYSGVGANPLDAVEPYSIEDYGYAQVGFVGVSTPYSITSSTPAYFRDEDGNYIYGFSSDTAEEFYDCVQTSVNSCIAEGADYVVLMCHLGENESYSPFSSVELIANTTGVDVVLDAHEHSTIPCRVEKNEEGDNVLLSSTGTKNENIGQLIITPGGSVSTGLIYNYPDKDSHTDSYIAGIKSGYETKMAEVIASSDTALSCFGEGGVRLVRSRETAIGDFCADAYRITAGADIAFMNGGGIRADIKAGDITFADIIAVNPFGNTLCMVEATGQEVLDALEFSCRLTGPVPGGKTEFGGFLQVSGLSFTVNTSVESGVKLDSKGMFAGVEGERRVGNVLVLQRDGNYAPIDPAKTYTVAANNYVIKNMGDGYSMFADNTLLIDEGITDYQLLVNYITDTLGGKLGAYSAPQGRITVE